MCRGEVAHRLAWGWPELPRFSFATAISDNWFLTFGCVCADHNIFDLKYFAADEAQSLDAILRNEEGAIDGVVQAATLRGVSARALRLTVIPQLRPPNLERLRRRSQCKSAPTLGF